MGPIPGRADRPPETGERSAVAWLFVQGISRGQNMVATTDMPIAAGVSTSSESKVRFGALAVAGLGSLGAGAIHATAIGVHGDHAATARTFAVLAALQLAWGAVALVASGRAVCVSGAILGAAAVSGWVLAKTSGISFVDGLGESEAIQFADAAAAALALTATVIALRHLMSGLSGVRSQGPGSSMLAGVGAGVLAVAIVAMVTAGGHSHAGTHGSSEAHDESTAHADGATHADSEAHGDDGTHIAAVPKPYDPTLPIDLSGTPGVTPAHQARAENLIAITLDRLPRYADAAVAEADGFRSIGDGFTGHEHFINWNYINDDHILNPDYPESLVYETGPGGSRKLVSAMFMMKQGATLDQVPDVGGALTQWHIHDDLCFTDDPVAPRVAGVTSVGGQCQPPLKKFQPTPMIHVWISPHRCGPFAALEGVAGGQVAEGETQLCDHAHGS